MEARDLMQHVRRTCGPQESLNYAAQIMWEDDCGCVPIVDGAGTLIGIITDRDIAMAAYTRGRRLTEISVVDTMARRVFSCEAGTPLNVAQQLMREHGLRRLPVVDANGKFVGLLTLKDLGRVAAQAADSTTSAVDVGELVETVAAVTGHHRTRGTARAESPALR